MKKIEFILKNIFLRILLFFKKNQNSKEGYIFNEKANILFIRLNRIGDALVATPLLHEIKSKLKSRLFVLADRKNKVAFENNPDIDELLIFNKGLKGYFEIFRFIKKEKIYTVVDLHDDVSTTVSFIIALCGAKNRFGLEKDNKLIFTKTVPRLDSSKFHVVERTMELARLFNLQPDGPGIKIHFYPDQNSFGKAEDFISQNYGQRKLFVGINISAGSPARFWGIENFKNLLEYFSSVDTNIVILSSPSDLKLAKQISNIKYKYFLSDSFSDFGAMITNLDFLFTPDTAAIHLASAFNIPTFGVYVKYQTNDMIWSPYNTKFDCVITEEENLTGISFGQVMSKLKPFFERIFFENNVYKQN